MVELLHIFAPQAPFLIGVALLYLVVYKFTEQAKRLTNAVIDGLTVNAKNHAFAWAIGCGYAVLASLQALADEAQALGWVHVAVAAKVLQPGLTAGLLFANRFFNPPDRKS